MSESAPPPPPTPQPSGANGSARNLLHAGLNYIEARGQLLQVEAKEAAAQAGRIAASGGIAAFFLSTAWLIALPAGIALAAEKAAMRWEYIALIAAGVHALIGLLFLAALRIRSRSLRPFQESLNQLREDRAWLATNPQQK